MYETLKKKNDFDLVYKKGKVFGNHYFTFRLIKNGLDYNRFGIVVSKRVSNKAVIRNKIRRQIKAYLNARNEDLKQGYDCIITAKTRCAGEEYKFLKKALDHLFKYSKFFKK